VGGERGGGTLTLPRCFLSPARLPAPPPRGLGASQTALKKIGEALELTPAQTEEVLLAAALVIDDAVFENRQPADIVAQLPADLNKNLRQLIAAIITKNLPKWRETAAANQISLPRLVDVDWRIDVKTASEVIARMAQPAVIVDLRVRWRRRCTTAAQAGCTGR